jgi:Zn-dependent metalloprotease
MPAEPTENGLKTFSMHAFESSSSDAIEGLRAERNASLAIRGDVTGPDSDMDPETVARRLLNQALASDAVPSLTAPVANSATSEFRTINTETVPLTGTRVVKFRQMVNGIPVYGSLVSVELDEGNSLVSIDSALGEPAGVNPIAKISPAAALAAAKAAPGGYKPNLTGVIPRLNYYFDSSRAKWRLVYILEDVPVTLDRSAGSKADQRSKFEPPRIVDFVVDAHRGQVVAMLPRTPSLDDSVEQTGIDAFGVERTFLASKQDGVLVLYDPVHNVRTYDFGFRDPSTESDGLPGDDITDPPEWTAGAVSAHANAVAVSDFLRAVLRRDNIDDRGSTMVSSINCVEMDETSGGNEWLNAFWNGDQMVYGQALRATELRSLAANLDVVTHEMFHGVTDRTSRLEYAFQSGALNESYSDIFAMIVSNLGNNDPRTWNWQLGENLKANNKPFRDMSDPTLFGQPAHMDRYRRLPNSRAGDWGGVHINSGIHNKAAFNMLTAERDDGTLTLTPDEVAGAFYLADTQRLSRTSQFADSRRAVVASARTLFRTLPLDEQESKISAIEAAFDAVGII